ncbi:MAG TPA: hypothetical protein VHS99_16590 [Chloroflexota bacterium]|nr:hypothetical protein [Chloroflexota bacterium]
MREVREGREGRDGHGARDGREVASPAAREADLALLRRYEPIIRYTVGEEFFPTDVERYLAGCSLWVLHPNGRNELLLEEGRVTTETLAAPRQAEFGAIYHLNFVEPLNIAELTAFLVNEGVKRLREQTRTFRPEIGRLARVGYVSRLLDALFSLTLFLRGRVPGDAAAAAALLYRRMQEREERYVYYGRVVREHGWIALQYWFFYPFNNWRSAFHGGNDHEADWEMVTVNLYQPAEGPPVPRWVAYASHDFAGDDVRRRWDDAAELERCGDHPVIYAGAGSHAAYFRPGEYLAELEVAFLAPLFRLTTYLRRTWARTLRRAGVAVHPVTGHTFRIPFVDYARGDGTSIGPGQPRVWTPVLLDPVPAWVSQYRGLWGFYARDPLSGENAPAGPMYNRDGSVRTAWADPVGWAGLDKVPTPTAELATLARRREALEARQQTLERQIAEGGITVQTLGVELAALEGNAHLAGHYAVARERLERLRLEARAMRKERAENEALLEAIGLRMQRLEWGEADDPRAHIRRLAEPASEPALRFRQVVEVWAALSIGLLLVGLVFLLVSARQYLVLGLAGMLGVFVIIEATFRRQLVRLISTITVGLAVVCAVVLVYEFFWQLAVLGVLLAGLYLLWENIRELTG